MANSYMTDIGSIYASAGAPQLKHNTHKTSPDLDMTDFLQLMVVQLQSQTIDNTADTSDMLNQMVQMQMVTALTNMTDASVMSYAGSLVGKEVTIGDYSSGQLVERVIKVMGSGQANGEQVIFSEEGEMFKLSSIMAVGRLPRAEGAEDGEENGDGEGSGADLTPGTGTANGGSAPNIGDIIGGITGGTTGSGDVTGSGTEENGGSGSGDVDPTEETQGSGSTRQPDPSETGAAEETVNRPTETTDPIEDDPTDIVDPTQAAEQGE